MKKTILMATAAIMLGATSCKNSISNDIEINGEWKVSAINGDIVPKTLETATLTFDNKSKSYSGVTGVNIINGSYQQKDNALTIGEGAMTRKMGDPVSNDVETKYINAIHATKSVALENRKLLLKDNAGNTLMELKR